MSKDGLDEGLALIEACQKQFAFYADNHRAKGTPDGDAKAVTNQEFADRCAAYLQSQPEQSAQSELSALREKLEMATKALEPFAEFATWAEQYSWPKKVSECAVTPVLGFVDYSGESGPGCEVTVGDFQHARETFSTLTDGSV